MAASIKSEAELEQIALAMMMMAGGEGTSGPGVKTRSSRSRTSEPVSGNCLNNNKKRNHDQPSSPERILPNLSSAPDPSLDFEDNVDIKEELPYVDNNEAIICAINPLSIQSSPPSPSSPAGSQRSTNSGSGSGGQTLSAYSPYTSSSRRIFKPEFKQMVLDAFSNDPECVGNQRATARKFGIHRRQVQKWLQQYSTGDAVMKASPQQDSPNDDTYSDATPPEPVRRKPSSTATRSLLTTRSKVITRRSTGNQQLPPLQQKGGRGSDPPSRGARTSARTRGKSMPLKGGSKSASHFVPTIVRPSTGSSTSVITSASLMNLSKGSKQNGGRGNTSPNYSSSAYYEPSGTNGGGTNGSNMFMNMSSFLASAAAAGNLTMPLSLENPRHFSPRDHSPINGRGSPTHSAGGSSGGLSGNGSSNLQNALLLVDELNLLYPYSDFSLLRKALLKEEVSLEKLAHPLLRHKADFRVNGNGVNSDLSQGLRNFRRSGSPSPAKSTSSSSEYNTQQTLDIIRQQQEYLKLLQQCGIGNSSSSGDLSGLNLADLTNNGRLPTWFNPFAAAAAAGLPVPSTSTSVSGKVNGNGSSQSDTNRRKAMSSSDNTSDNHRFASPRVPPVNSTSSKAKTVAAALAATRVQSTSQVMGRSFQSNHNSNGRANQNQRNGQRRKGNTRQRNVPSQMEDDIDPTSMLEVVTSIPSPHISPRTTTNSNQYSYNQRNTEYHNQSQGMDLTTTAPAPSRNTATTTSTTTRLISKAMNKEYSFLSELGLVRKSPETNETTTSANSNNNAYGITHTASLENFVQNILPPRQKSPQAASSSASSSSPPMTELSNDSEKTKHMVIDAFNFDPEISGDARAVARKFGLNVRVVMKWLKEGPVKTSPQSNDEYNHCTDNGLPVNHSTRGMNGDVDEEEEDSSDYLHTQNLHKALLSESNNNSATTTVNKRKNSKPNQICDFAEDEAAGLNGALDMVVPIKKRRVSSPSPTPQDA